MVNMSKFINFTHFYAVFCPIFKGFKAKNALDLNFLNPTYFQSYK